MISDRVSMLGFPKIELHRHLEGTFHIDTLYRIAHKNGLDYPKDKAIFTESVQFPKNHQPDFLLFLSKFKNNWYSSFKDIEDITYNSVKAMKEDNIYYIELRFSPEHFALHNNFNRIDVSRAVIDAARNAAYDADFNIKFLLTFNRGKQKQDEMLHLYKQLIEADLPDIVGLDLAGDEINYKGELFSDFFKQVALAGQHKITIHAGEVTPAETIYTAIQDLYACRIGHGTAAINDPALQRLLIQEDIALEQCITSNYQTGSWIDEQNHPFGRLFRNNVPVTLNSDDPTIQNCLLGDDYNKAVKYFNLSIDDLITANKTAIRTSFLSRHEKEVLLKGYLKAINSYKESFASVSNL